jgi:hypothetical protein
VVSPHYSDYAGRSVGRLRRSCFAVDKPRLQDNAAAHPAAYAAHSPGSGSHQTRRWREMDSNHRSLLLIGVAPEVCYAACLNESWPVSTKATSRGAHVSNFRFSRQPRLSEGSNVAEKASRGAARCSKSPKPISISALSM